MLPYSNARLALLPRLANYTIILEPILGPSPVKRQCRASCTSSDDSLTTVIHRHAAARQLFQCSRPMPAGEPAPNQSLSSSIPLKIPGPHQLERELHILLQNPRETHHEYDPVFVECCVSGSANPPATHASFML